MSLFSARYVYNAERFLNLEVETSLKKASIDGSLFTFLNTSFKEKYIEETMAISSDVCAIRTKQ